MRIIKQKDGETLTIGKVGENLATRVLFPVVGAWREKFGEGTFRLFFKRPNDTESYLVVTETDDENVIWNVTNTDLAEVGTGVCELDYVFGTVVVKSALYTCKIQQGIAPEGDTPPEPWSAWVDEVLDAAETIEDGIGDLDVRMESLEEVTPTSASPENPLIDEETMMAELSSKLSEPQSGIAPGNILQIASVDVWGHPVLKAVKCNPTFELLKSVTLSEDVESVSCTTDSEGNPFHCTDLFVRFKPASSFPSEKWLHVNLSGMTTSSIAYPGSNVVSNFFITFPSAVENNVFGAIGFTNSQNGFGYCWRTYATSNPGYGSFNTVRWGDCIIQSGDITGAVISNELGIFEAGSKLEFWGVRA